MKGGRSPSGFDMAETKLRKHLLGRIKHIRRSVAGFTIIEVLVVLGVSSLIFVMAALMISGRQNKTGFITAINDVPVELQQIINDVVNGYYPNANNFSCTQNSGSPPSLSTASPTGQGTNANINSNEQLNGCIFLGKAVQFAVCTSSCPDTSHTSPLVNIYPVVGNLANSSGSPAQGLSDSNPILLAPGTAPPQSGYTFFSPEAYNLQYGLTVAWMCYSTTSTPCTSTANMNSIVFANSPSSPSATSDSQQINAVAIPGGSLGDAATTAVNNIDTNLATAPVDPLGGIEICLKSGGTNQSGLITIGGNSRKPVISLSIKASQNCT